MYVTHDNLAVTLINIENGEELAVITTNLSTEEKRSLDCAFINTNNMGEDFLIWLLENKIGTLTGAVGFSVYCVYPEMRFNMNMLEEKNV